MGVKAQTRPTVIIGSEDQRQETMMTFLYQVEHRTIRSSQLTLVPEVP